MNLNDQTSFSWTTQDYMCAGFPIQLYDCKVEKAPIVYLVAHEVDPQLLSFIQDSKTQPFSLACICISSAQWNTLLAPWNTPSNFPKYLRCQGKASEYLKIFLNELIPSIQSHLSYPYGQAILAGYSLAGLFSVWTMCECDLFAGICAVSGSFWFPDFKTWFLQNIPKHLPSCVYFSTSESEWNSKNSHLSSLKSTLKAIQETLAQKGVKTICEINPGNHFQDPTQRLASGIEWILKECP